MIKLILLITILILVIYMTFSNIDNERFIDSDNEIDVNKCNFVPWGPDLKSCTNYCLNSDSKLKELYNINNECNLEICTDICKDCKNIERCQWFNTENIPNKETPLDNNIILTNSDSEKKIQWNKLNYINNYMVHYKQTAPEYDQTKIIYTPNNELSYKSELVTGINLNPNGKYTFKVYGLNNFGIIEESNIITVST